MGVLGERTNTLNPEQLERLLAAFERADYFSLEDAIDEIVGTERWTSGPQPG